MVMVLAPDLGLAQMTADYNTAMFSWTVPAFDETNAPEGFALTCNSSNSVGGSAVISMPSTTIPASQVVSGSGSYACTISSFNIMGNSPDSAPLAVQFTNIQVSGIPYAPTNPLVLASAPSPPVVSVITPLAGVAQFTSTASSGSTSVTIPTGASFLAIGVSGYRASSGFFSTHSLVLDGQPLSVIAADSDTNAFMGSLFYLVNPPSGSHTLSWNWGSAPNDGVLFAWRTYAGVNLNAPIRSSYGAQQMNNPHATGTLIAQSGDLILVFCEQYTTSDITFSWTGATLVSTLTRFGTAAGSWAEASPSGNQSVSASTSIGSDGGIMGLVLRPAGGS